MVVALLVVVAVPAPVKCGIVVDDGGGMRGKWFRDPPVLDSSGVVGAVSMTPGDFCAIMMIIVSLIPTFRCFLLLLLLPVLSQIKTGVALSNLALGVPQRMSDGLLRIKAEAAGGCNERIGNFGRVLFSNTKSLVFNRPICVSFFSLERWQRNGDGGRRKGVFGTVLSFLVLIQFCSFGSTRVHACCALTPADG